MRRFVIAMLVCTLGVAWAKAAPFDQVSNRLKQYDDQVAAPERIQPRPAPIDDQGPPPTAGQDQFLDEGYGPDMGPGYDPDYGGPGCGGPGCGDSCCGGSCGFNCAPPCGFWGRAEYLYWWVRGSNTPALVTSSPDGTPSNVAGILPTANVLFGNQRINTNGRSGGRFTLGYWFGNCGLCGIEDTFFFLGSSSTNYQATSDGSPILARPFFNVLSGAQDALLVAYPNIVVGTINVASTRSVYGNELNLRRALYADQFRRFDVLAGYRLLYLGEGLDVSTNTTSIDPAGQVPVGTTFGILDRFATNNNFNGGQLGVSMEVNNGRWSISSRFKVALGSVAQRVTINGSTVTTEPGQAPTTATGGVLALSSNSGHYTRNQFGVLPEFGLDLHYQLTPLWRLNLGYTILGLTNVVRPGDQIDTSINPNLFPPPIAAGSQPAFAFKNSDVLIQGINFGIEANF